jgi:hypothetical protein
LQHDRVAKQKIQLSKFSKSLYDAALAVLGKRIEEEKKTRSMQLGCLIEIRNDLNKVYHSSSSQGRPRLHWIWHWEVKE